MERGIAASRPAASTSSRNIFKRQAANRPQSLKIEGADELIVNGKIDLAELVMVIAGSLAGGP